MAPIAKEPDSLTARLTGADAASLAGAKVQPAAAEIPVTVNGARTVEGTDKREPFSETTQTVLVLPKGAVIRLSSAVAPGQLLFLTNEKTKKEVVCQVVKSKSHAGASGYVELEFTEPAPGFWGLRFSGSSSPAVAFGSPKPAVAIPGSATKSLDEKLAEVKAKEPAATAISSPKPTETRPVARKAPLEPPLAIPAADPNELKPAPDVPAQAPTSAGKIPTLSEFLMPGSAGPELKVPERAKSENSAKNDAKNGAKNGSANAQQSFKTERPESLSSLLVPPAPKENPAPGTSTFDFGMDEVKIPAWLEPLARNSSATPVQQETKASVVIDLDAKLAETKLNEAKPSESSPSALDDADQTETRSLAGETSFDAPVSEAAELSLSGEGPTPNFGSSLAFGAKSVQPEVATERSGTALKFGLAAAGLLLAATGGWYWYSSKPKDVPANLPATAQNNFATFSSANNAPAVATPANTSQTNSALSGGANRNSVNPAPGQSATPSATASMNNSLKPAAPLAASTQRSLPTVEAAKKPSFGNVHLAAPKVSKRTPSSDSGASEELALNSAVAGGDVAGGDPGSHLNLLASREKQPAAPVPVGGNVKQARLISSVPPVYPQLARTQRMSGNVVVDALIDTNGRVSTMKVLSGPALLHQSAMDALRQWKYEPATLNGQPMAMHLTVTIQFKLQ
jgi:TonB family protein